MARKKRKKKEPVQEETGIKEETIQAIITIALFVLGIFLILASFDKAGIVGVNIYKWLKTFLGIGYFLLPFAIFVSVFLSWKAIKQEIPRIKIFGIILFLLSGLGLTNIIIIDRGGLLGNLISTPLINLFDIYTSIIILGAIFTVSLLIIFDANLSINPFNSIWDRLSRKKKEEEDALDALDALDDENEETTEEEKEEEEDEETEPEQNDEKPRKNPLGFVKKTDEEIIDMKSPLGLFNNQGKEYTPPPLSLLEKDKGKPGVGDIKANANIIKRTLQNFGINVEMDEISIGPSVTRYALKPAEGVKLSRIVALQNDLALALAAHPIRIEAPIPGKSLVGIEIPNNTKSIVGLATLLGAEEYRKSNKSILVSLGKGISGKSHFADLAKMPHMLIAGATGAGKSVTIHALITSLLFRNSPENLKFIMIDPKRVELTMYNKIPHLLTPVITDAKKAILSLKWAAKEMDRRYDILESESVRDIASYHANVLEPALEKSKKNKGADTEEAKMPGMMPYIVIIIDELADIMSTYPRELEASIVRLAQMSRAVGIHLILSTQRPSVNVITGLIKANVPARIALQVSSQIDSRTILDTGGAEKLLGAGDMLFLSGEMSKPSRIQSAYISENEVKKIVNYLKESYKDEIPNELDLTGGSLQEKNSIFDSNSNDEDNDDLYEQAKEEVIQAGKASTSYIQRKLRVGYARAARLMDMLEERGIIGGADGSKPREVINNNPVEETGGEDDELSRPN